jgi:hypothetical protein
LNQLTDIPATFLKAYIDKIFLVNLAGTMVNIFLGLDCSKYKTCLTLENMSAIFERHRRQQFTQIEW